MEDLMRGAMFFLVKDTGSTMQQAFFYVII